MYIYIYNYMYIYIYISNCLRASPATVPGFTYQNISPSGSWASSAHSNFLQSSLTRRHQTQRTDQFAEKRPKIVKKYWKWVRNRKKLDLGSPRSPWEGSWGHFGSQGCPREEKTQKGVIWSPRMPACRPIIRGRCSKNARFKKRQKKVDFLFSLHLPRIMALHAGMLHSAYPPRGLF